MSKDEIIGLCIAVAFIAVYGSAFICIGIIYLRRNKNK